MNDVLLLSAALLLDWSSVTGGRFSPAEFCTNKLPLQSNTQCIQTPRTAEYMGRLKGACEYRAYRNFTGLGLMIPWCLNVALDPSWIQSKWKLLKMNTLKRLNTEPQHEHCKKQITYAPYTQTQNFAVWTGLAPPVCMWILNTVKKEAFISTVSDYQSS